RRHATAKSKRRRHAREQRCGTRTRDSIPAGPMASEERVTYCRICEPLCGLVATVDDGEVTRLRPDRDHPLSKGFACPKGMAMTGVQNDPDRVTHPLRKRADGTFEKVSWETALDDIGRRLKSLIRRHGGESV